MGESPVNLEIRLTGDLKKNHRDPVIKITETITGESNHRTALNTTLIVYDEYRGNEGGRESYTSGECLPLAKKPGPSKFTSTWNVFVCVWGGCNRSLENLYRGIPILLVYDYPRLSLEDRTLLGYDHPRGKFPRIELSPSITKRGKRTGLEYFFYREGGSR